MAVRVHCSICEKFVRNVEQYDFQKLTGHEICKKCGERVSKVYGELDKLVTDSTKEIEEHRKKMAKVTGAFNEIVKKYTENIKSFHITRTAELDNRMKDILKGE